MVDTSISSGQLQMSELYLLNTAQETAAEHCLTHDCTLLVADKGAGKTRLGLAIAAESEGRTLILCPNKVRSGWLAEGETLGVEVALVDGNADVRKAMLKAEHLQILVMGVDLLPWLVDAFKGVLPFSGLILDETTRFSSPGSVGVKKLRRAHKSLDWVLGLTASPVMEDPMALYGQALVIDGGQSLGRSYDRFKRDYFYPLDYMGYDWAMQPGADRRLAEAVAGLIYYMEDTAYADELVPLTEELVMCTTLPTAFHVAYADICEEMAATVGGVEIEAANEAVVSGKLEQLCQGAVYDDAGRAHWVHFRKFEALARILDLSEPTIVVYSFKFELAELRARWPEGRDLKDAGALEAFNSGGLNLLFMHPRSGSHGINAQVRCCEMICLKPIWSADGWDQIIGRIRRRGQTRPCRRRVLVVPGTVDQLILDRVAGKEQTGSTLLDHIKAKARK